MTESKSIPIDPPLNPRPRAVVVGASSGIGAALAQKLAAEGYLVAVLARRKDALEALCHQINAAAGETRALAYPHDVSDFDAVPGTFQKILRDLGGVDVFAFVAGVQFPLGGDEYDFRIDRETIEVNLLGAMAWLNQAALLFDRMGSGHLVGISSVAGDRGRVGNPPYHVSKAGLSTYLESLRNRLTRKGVHVLTVKPGFVQTHLFEENATASFGVISPEKATQAIWGGIRRRKQVVYTPGWWRWMMLVIRHMPSFIFRRLSF